MKPFLFFCTLCLTLASLAHAAPDPPLENLLQRAETVILARVTSVGERSATFRRTALLRGTTGAEITFSWEWDAPFVPLQVGSKFLLLSQSDARFGPAPRVLGRPMHAQHIWCGWTPLPMVETGDQVYAECIYSFIDGQPFTDGPLNDPISKLSLSRIKRLLERFPYNSHINDQD